MEGPIAFEIRDYVKQALQVIRIPAFFLNSVVNVVIPPLVTHILAILGAPVWPVSLLSMA